MFTNKDVFRILTAKRLAWGIIAFGVILRAAQYLFNAALYVDEGALALNIIKRSFAGLLQPLDSEQAAPVGFLFLEKLAFLAFGESEYALRLFPFLFSIIALYLFYEVAQRCFRSWTVPIALAFFAVSGHVIYYAAQIKQYSSDIAITLLVILLGLELESKQLNGRRWAIFALVGAIVVWLSHPAVFVLAGVGLTLSLSAMSKKDWPRFWKLAGVYAVWVLSFAAFYLISLRNLSGNETLEKSWAKKGTFMPLVPRSLADLEWYPGAIVKMFSNPGGLPFPLIAAIIFLIGCVALFLKNKQQLLMFTAPLLLTMLASGLHKYPFGRRLLLFLIPAVLMVVASGIEYIINKKPPYSIAAGGAIAALLLFQPAGGATSNMLHPYARQDIKPIMAYVRDHKQSGDVVYVYHHQRESFLYYAKRYGFTESDYVLGIDARDETKRRADWEAYKKDLDRLRGRSRAWLMFSHIRRIQNIREDEFMLQNLNSVGTKLDEFIPGETSSSSDAEETDQAEPDEFTPAPASAYLYDLTEK
ncbi:MAG TPA: glycosyltransferase family 39 protein [Blastocatellia bacterium]|nr:glycosyltransferase family 39 protein [Blastocatellia bacterium]